MEPLRIVVVPFDNRTGDASFDTLGLVASDWISRNLSYYGSEYQVVPTTTSLAFVRSAQLNRFELLERAERLARGTRAQIMVWGSFYVSGDSLRFSVEVSDLETQRMVGNVPQISAPLDGAMRGVDRLRSAVVGAILRTESAEHPIPRRVPRLSAYNHFVAGLDTYLRKQYRSASEHFSIASARDTSYLPHLAWLVSASHSDRQFARADSAAAILKTRSVARIDEPHALRALSRLHGNQASFVNESYWAAASNPADDMAAFEFALAALAAGRPRQARQLFGELKPNHGYLHGKPEYYLHYAAAYHLVGNHRAELNVVRSGLKVRERSLDIRLANCRARAALGRPREALAAAGAIMSPDTDISGATMTVGAAMEDCAAELDAHGLTDVAKQAIGFATAWYRVKPRPSLSVRDSIYEKPYILFEEARALAIQGNRASALNALGDAVYNGLPVYEPGRMILHAEPAFRTLRTTRGFLRINQPRG